MTICMFFLGSAKELFQLMQRVIDPLPSYNPYSQCCGAVKRSVFDGVGVSACQNAPKTHSIGTGITLMVLVLVLVSSFFLTIPKPHHTYQSGKEIHCTCPVYCTR